MILLRRILLAILLLLIVFVSIAFLLPRKITLGYTVGIPAQRAIVYEQLSIPGNWPNWYPQNEKSVNPNVNSNKWNILEDGKIANYGNISFQITRSYPYDSLLLEVNTLKGIDLQAHICVFDTLSRSSVTCTVQFDLGTNPINRWIGLMIRKSSESSLKQALLSLKEYVSGLPVAGIKVEMGPIAAKSALVIRDTTSTTLLDAKLETMYKMLSSAMIRQKLKPSGPPFLIYHSIQSNRLEIEAGIPINSKIKSDKMVSFKEFSAENAIKATVFGKQNKSLVYRALGYYQIANKISLSGPVWEIYITDPSVEPDPEKWQTDIYYPISNNNSTK